MLYLFIDHTLSKMLFTEMPVGHGKKKGLFFLKSEKPILGQKKPLLGHTVSLKI